jgi:hypothetical protein
MQVIIRQGQKNNFDIDGIKILYQDLQFLLDVFLILCLLNEQTHLPASPPDPALPALVGIAWF